MTSTGETRESVSPPAWHAQPSGAVLSLLESAERGLSEAEAEARLGRHGPNRIERARGESPLTLLWRQINNPLVWVLLGATALALAVGKGTDALVVLSAVVINAVIGFVQEHRAGRAIEALASMVPTGATVRRDGRQVGVPAEHLVPGDLVILQAGDRVPADLRLLEAKNLRVEEAALTGESVPVEKQTDPVPEGAALGDRRSMAYGGTHIAQGAGLGAVVATGAGTELGRISQLLTQTTQLETPLTRQLESVGRWITAVVVVLCLVFFAYGYLVRQSQLTDALLVAIALAVAAIPEGLPAIITISLAIGVRRMAARKAVVRYLPAVETLGSTSVIGSDKTGTLTRNEMTVQALWAEGREYRLSGVGYEPVGDLRHGDVPLASAPEAVRELLTGAVLCNDAAIHPRDGAWSVTGDPTEAALLVAGRKIGLDERELSASLSRSDSIPFDSAAKYMATLHRLPEGGTVAYLKGAPEVVLERCGLDPATADAVHRELEALAQGGMRVLAVGRRSWEKGAPDLGPEDVREGLAFLGLVGMIDPPRPEAIEAIRACQRAGITVKMITGDHPATAAAIGAALGLGAGQPARTGPEIGRMGDAELEEAVGGTNVFARVAPEHKLRLVEARQRASERRRGSWEARRRGP